MHLERTIPLKLLGWRLVVFKESFCLQLYRNQIKMPIIIPAAKAAAGKAILFAPAFRLFAATRKASFKGAGKGYDGSQASYTKDKHVSSSTDTNQNDTRSQR